MFITKKVFLSFLVFLLVFCSFRQFEDHNKSLKKHEPDSIPILQINGYYYYAEKGKPLTKVYDAIRNLNIDTADIYYELLFFYSDSTFYIYNTVLESSVSIKSIIDNRYFLGHNKKIFKNIGAWGHYNITNDSIHVVISLIDNSRMPRKISEELYLKLISKDTIVNTKRVCPRCKNQYSDYGNKSEIIFDPPKKFVFVPYLFKPDSSLVKKR